MRKYIYIGLFGFFGAVLRFVIKNMHICPYKEVIPVNTLLINVTGSFIIALVLTLAGEAWNMKEELRLGITTGFLGAYTTFSSLCKETVQLINKGLYSSALSYVAMSTVFGLFAVYLGVNAAKAYIAWFSGDAQDEIPEQEG